MLCAVKTMIGREDSILRLLELRIKQKEYRIKAICFIERLKGYIFIEGMEEDISSALNGIRHVKKIVSREVKPEEIEHFLKEKRIKVEVKRGDIVEIVGGPFKGGKGKITRIDDGKSEVVLEILDTAVPVSVTLGMDSIKILERK